jgi:hypothetical protein
MSATIRARYDGPAAEGVDLTVELDNGEFRQVHVKQGGLLPDDIDGNAVSTAFRDSLLDQDGWSRYRQPATTTKGATGAEKEA